VILRAQRRTFAGKVSWARCRTDIQKLPSIANESWPHSPLPASVIGDEGDNRRLDGRFHMYRRYLKHAVSAASVLDLEPLALAFGHRGSQRALVGPRHVKGKALWRFQSTTLFHPRAGSVEPLQFDIRRHTRRSCEYGHQLPHRAPAIYPEDWPHKISVGSSH